MYLIGSVASLLVFGGVGFFVFVFIVGVVVSMLVDSDRLKSAGAVVLATLLFLYLLGDVDPFGLAAAHPLLTVLFVPAYLVAGVAWSVFKWGAFLHNRRNRIREIEVETLRLHSERTHELDEDSARLVSRVEMGEFDAESRAVEREETRIKDAHEANKRDAENFLIRDSLLNNAGIHAPLKPIAAHNKARIIAWMAYWPASLAWFALNDPFWYTCEFLHARFSKLFQSMSDKAFDGVVEKNNK